MKAEDLPPLDWDEEEVTVRDGKIPPKIQIRQEREERKRIEKEGPPTDRREVWG